MAMKRISIDVEAYGRLEKLKRKDETFSQVIKRVVPAPFDFDAWLKSMARDPFSDSSVEAIEQQVAMRRASRRTLRRRPTIGRCEYSR